MWSGEATQQQLVSFKQSCCAHSSPEPRSPRFHSRMRVFLLFLLLLSAFQLATSLNILGVFVYPSFKHWTVHNALIAELSKRGHNLTVITNFPTTETTSNYRELHVKPFYDPEIEGDPPKHLINPSVQ